MPWASIAASVGGSLVSGMMGSDSAEGASNAQGQSSAAAIAEQRRQYDQTRTDLAPYRNTGGAAVNKLAIMLGLQRNAGVSHDELLSEFQGGGRFLKRKIPGYTGPTGEHSGQDEEWLDTLTGRTNQTSAPLIEAAQADAKAGPQDADYGTLNKKFTLADFWDDPVTKASYQFGLDTGTKALDNMAGARGNRNSGAQLKALTKFGTDYTGTKVGDSYNRFYGDQDRTFNRLAGVAGTGQTAATNTALMGSNTANTIGGLVTAQGNARGAAAIAGGNAMSGGIQNAANSIQNWWNRQQGPANSGNYNTTGSFQPYYAMSSDNYG